MLLADHSLAEVQLRYAECHRALVPQNWWLCCFCKNEIEDPPHAMFGCNGSSEIIALQTAFLASIFDLCHSLHMNALSATPGSFFTLAISHRPISDILAKFAYDILQVFAKKEIYLVDSTLYSNSNAVVNTSASIFIPSNSML